MAGGTVEQRPGGRVETPSGERRQILDRAGRALDPHEAGLQRGRGCRVTDRQGR